MTERTWLPVPPASDFPIENLPFGVARPAGGTPRVVTRIGDHLLDLPAAGIAPELTARTTLNALMESGRGAEVRTRAAELLTGPERPDAIHLMRDVEVLLPIQVGDYVDFYSSIQHATNLGRIFRPEGDPLPANWRHLPIGYHGRAGTVLVSGSRIARPSGLVP
ncbi:MAG: fumarylacetoacetase, partial [Actinomycetota bacterium]|nr:fumarylacetoacetase [Actinomycetota bacterium]